MITFVRQIQTIKYAYNFYHFWTSIYVFRKRSQAYAEIIIERRTE